MFCCLDLWWFKIRMIWTVATAVAKIPTIQKGTSTKKYLGYLAGFGMVGLFSFGMPFKHQNKFQ